MCYRTEPSQITMFTVFMLCYRTEPSQYSNVHSVHAVCCVTGLSPASITMFTVFMLCAVLQDQANVITQQQPPSLSDCIHVVHSLYYEWQLSQNNHIHSVHAVCSVARSNKGDNSAAAPKSQWLYSCCSFTVLQYATEPE